MHRINNNYSNYSINNIRMNYPEDYLFTEKYISNFEKL